MSPRIPVDRGSPGRKEGRIPEREDSQWGEASREASLLTTGRMEGGIRGKG
jgi:hypothetical protein